MAKIRIKGDTSGYIDIAAPAVAGTQTLTLPTSGSLLTSADVLDSDQIGTGAVTAAKLDVGQIGGRRNLIINGAMQVAQRGTSFTTDGYTLDRFYWQDIRQDELAVTVTQDSNTPAGFANSLKIVAGTAESAWGADEFARFFYKIEAQDLQHLNYGTSDAVTTTLSFWVKSDVTGTYCVSFYVPDAGRRLTNTYTINSADTWEYKTLAVVGDVSGTGINNDNGEGIQISFCLAAGSDYTGTDSTSWVNDSDAATFYGHNVAWGTTTSDYWQITGVQLEVGTVATPFEHRSYGEELALCQRYYQAYEGSGARGFAFDGLYASGAGSGLSMSWAFPVQMRSAPSHTKLYNDTLNVSSVNVATTIYGVQLETIASGSGRTAYKANGSGYIRFDAEL
jgi:hypothetical protein